MKPFVYVVPKVRSSPPWCRAFAAGSGGRIRSLDDARSPGRPIALFGAVVLWPLLTQARRSGVDWYYGDHGYFRRWTYYRCTKNAFQCDGRSPTTPQRFENLQITIKPWQGGGSHILVCPPDETFASLMGFDAVQWCRAVSDKLKQVTDRPVRFRPRQIRRRPLWRDLHNCWALVTYTSNAAVDAILQGVPVFCLGPCAASAVGLDNLDQIENPIRPDNRFEWACALANNQWTLKEMERGDLWRAIGG